MGVLSKLFGKGTSDSSGAKEPPPEEKPIRVFDGYGRELFVSRDEWQKNILPGNLKKNWDDPDALYSIIVQSLQDGFVSDVAVAARRLFQIDSNAARGATVLGIVEMELGRLDVAESVLKQALKGTKDDGVLLTNLAKVIAKKGALEESERNSGEDCRQTPTRTMGCLGGSRSIANVQERQERRRRSNVPQRSPRAIGPTFGWLALLYNGAICRGRFRSTRCRSH